MTEDKQAAAIKSENASTKRAPTQSDPAGDTELEKTRALIADYEARMDEVTTVITRVRHEINNPLTGVLGQAQLLLREDLSDKARKRVETIEQLAMRLRDIVAQLRQVQKNPKN